jgi:MFS family permease
MEPFRPSDTLRSRTFVGLLVAQFLAAFNDQALHASAMFFAINTNTLSEARAISLMPILFYAPWAIFCTVAGWLADRYSKRNSLVFWKVVEVGITLTALAGFWLGRHGNAAGPYVVLSTVFLMGMHSAFFVPAKYGAMPEILQPHMLSRGNGLLESLSFLAIILGTVFGGVLSWLCGGSEYLIGVILTVLAVVGAVASLLIRRMPAADPRRPFPPYLVGPLWQNLREIARSRPLALAVIGIAFFTFVVAFMRAAVYLLGEVQAPRWEDWQISAVVGLVAFGIGLGSPLAGFLSGGKVELGLVPLGALSMAVLAAVAALPLDPHASLPLDLASIDLFRAGVLFGSIVLLGFFTGFYIVPLYTLLQERAPKTSKGDFIATSNLLNVTGAILASLVVWAADLGATGSGFAPELPQSEVAAGTLTAPPASEKGRPTRVVIDGRAFPPEDGGGPAAIIDPIAEDVHPGAAVVLNRYEFAGVAHYRLRPAGKPVTPAYDKRGLPRVLFLSAAALTVLTYLTLRSRLPDLGLRMLLWLRRLRRHGLEVNGMERLPTSGPVLLATNASDLDGCLSVLSSTDRMSRFVLERGPGDPPLGGLTWLLAKRESLAVLPDKGVNWDEALARSERALDAREVVGAPLVGDYPAGWLNRLFAAAAARESAVLPVRVDVRPGRRGRRTVYLTAGEPLPAGADAAAARQAIEQLAEAFQAQAEGKGAPEGGVPAA